jgi:hypothetical protein
MTRNGSVITDSTMLRSNGYNGDNHSETAGYSNNVIGTGLGIDNDITVYSSKIHNNNNRYILF